MRRKGRILSEINVTPLVDVMLVLLIIFMITAPMMKRGVVMELPRAKATVMRLKSIPVVISVTKRGYYFNGKRVSLKGLKLLARRVLSSKPDASFVIEAQRDVPFESVVRVLAELRNMGISRVGIATRPERKGR